MTFPRASGVLLHPTSLAGDFGIGDLGEEAYRFVNFLERAQQSYWQILPLGPTGYGDSPYQSFSAFAGNTHLISPQKLVEEGLLTTEEIYQKPDFPENRVDFGAIYEWKNWILPKAFERFQTEVGDNLRDEFGKFSRQNASWLDDYALYRAVKEAQNQRAWYEWDEPLRLRHENALNDARQNLRTEIEAQKFYQFLFFKQWAELKSYAGGKNIKIIGDVPIFVARDSADVWCNPQEFKLNEDGSPKVVAGVPPDYFSKTGQLWGNPIYDWQRMRENNFRWWIERVRFTLKTVDILRVDHFRGFVAAWEVPGGDATAENGNWAEVPGEELFKALENALGELPVMAEDLGVMTPEVEHLRDSFGFPGMRILQYGFGGDAKNRDLPHNYIQNSVAYTGTHDNDTTVGWFKRDGGQINRERTFCMEYLKSDGREIHWDFIRAVFASVADTAIVPMQDLLGLENDARMNLPASDAGNWQWRCRRGDLSDEIAGKLRHLTEIYGRTQA